MIVHNHLEALKGSVLPTEPMNQNVYASLAALSLTDRTMYDSSFANFRVAIESNKVLKKAVGIRNFNDRLKKAISALSKVLNTESTDANVPMITYGDSRANAESFLAWTGLVDGFPRFGFWKNMWYEYNETTNHYVPIDGTLMRARASEFLSEAILVTSDESRKAPNDEKLINEILASSVYLTHIDNPDSSCHIAADRKTKPTALDVIAFRNVAIDTQKYTSGNSLFLVDKGPEKFIVNVIDIDYNPDAKCPKFLAFLSEICGNDAEMLLALQLFVGYLLTRDTSLQSLFLLVGVPNSGKGTFLRIITKVCGGPANVVTTSLGAASSDFGQERFIGKSVGIFSDTHSGGRDAMKGIEFLLTVSGEDATSIDQKYQKACDAQLKVRFVLTMNELVQLADRAGALDRRFIAFSFSQSFAKVAKGNLSDELVADELPGICNWGLEGLRRLSEIRRDARARGESDVVAARKAMQPRTGKIIIEKMRDLGTPLQMYVDEHCVFWDNATISEIELYHDYQMWCEQGGMKATTRARFISDLQDAFPTGTQCRHPPIPHQRGATGEPPLVGRHRCLDG